MKIEQRQYKLSSSSWHNNDINEELKEKYQLVIWFWHPNLIKDSKIYKSLKEFYPSAEIVLVSTAGEILNTEVSDDTVCVTAVYFEKTNIKTIKKEINDMEDSYKIWEEISKEILGDKLKHLLIFSDWLNVNGSELVKSIRKNTPNSLTISWWLAWDWVDFKKTNVYLNNPDEKNNIVVVWLYWDSLKVSSGSKWWWDEFWIKRKVTKSKNNIVYELDNEPILDLYKNYLWKMAKDLPSSWLLFPLSINEPGSKTSVVRTLLAIDEKEKSITFAWDIPEGYTAQLMKANFERIIDWAWDAAKNNIDKVKNAELAIIISCVWRKLILKQRIEEEIESVKEIVWEKCKIAWFYSYWEIGPSNSELLDCQLHNQSITVTLFNEI